MDNSKDQITFKTISGFILLGEFEYVKQLLTLNPEVINEAEHGETLLHIACDNSQYEVAELLLDLGVNPDVQNANGESALHLSVFRGAKRIVNLLLTRKSSPNLLTLEQKSALHYAAEYKEPEMIKILLLHGASPLLQDSTGRFPYELSGDYSTLFPQNYPMPMIFEATPTEELNSTINSIDYFEIKQDPPEIHLQTNRISYKEEMYDFLNRISLRNYYKSFIEYGFDNLEAMVLQMKTPLPISHRALEEAGIREEVNRIKVIKSLERLSERVKGYKKYHDVKEMLEHIKLTRFYSGFERVGLGDLKKLRESVRKSGLGEKLMIEIGIDKPGHRIRVIGILMGSADCNQSKCSFL